MMKGSRPTTYRSTENSCTNRLYINLDDLVNEFRQDRKEEPTERKFRGYVEGKFGCGEITEPLYREAINWIDQNLEE